MARQIFDAHHTEKLLSDLSTANSEAAKKERFLVYLTTLFGRDGAGRALIEALALGAERTIAQIPRGPHGLKKGRADTQTDTIIIEWERDIAKTGAHAVQQLEEYLAGNWRSGREYRFVLVTTDGIRWRVHAPDWKELKAGFELGHVTPLRQIRSFDLTRDTIEEFPFFLDEIFFVSQPKIATLENIQADFGNSSAAFLNSIGALRACLDAMKQESELRVAFDQWKRFLSIAYGSFDDSPEMYLVHTYLSVFAKLIAYAVLTGEVANDEKTLREVLKGAEFNKLNVDRFVEDDFFHWVYEKSHFGLLRPMFREINRRISEYDFARVEEDILKGVYQELIDLETRHALGEYYTPDWLCERMIAELNPTPDQRVLDPACGSGSFLRAVIAHLHENHPRVSADKIASQVCGIDIHPLSVQIAKTTMLLALGKGVATARKPVVLQIYLANSLLVPKASADLFKSSFKVNVDNALYTLDVSGITDATDFDRLIEFCDVLLQRYEQLIPASEFKKLAAALPKGGDHLLDDLYKIYAGMKSAVDNGRDSIWKFILQNSYKPVFMRSLFDLVVGNPPWLTYAGVANAGYQAALKEMADEYSVTPAKKNMPHLEIAAIFLAHSINYFLKPSGRLGFVLPRSFMSADQHWNTRAGIVSGIKLTVVWDLDGVSPLFRVPCCAIFGGHGNANAAQNRIPIGGLPGVVFSGKLHREHLHWNSAKQSLRETPTKWFLSTLQKTATTSRTALTETQVDAAIGANYYAKEFKQGATIVPRSFYFIEFEQSITENSAQNRVLEPSARYADHRTKVTAARTSESILRDAKAPWKSITVKGRVDWRNVFRTAISKNVLPFLLADPPWVVLPVSIEGSGVKVRFVLQDDKELLALGAKHTSAWMHSCKEHWLRKRTQRSAEAKMGFLERLDFQRGLTEQRPFTDNLVLYTGSATDASAVVVQSVDFDAPFVVDHKTYWAATGSLAEAHYVCAYLNSGYANEQIKEFQSRGLFGARDIHKLIVSLPFPKYDSGSTEHRRLSELGASCAGKAKAFRLPSEDMDARTLGRARSSIREGLHKELDEIDQLVAKISTGRHLSQVRSSGRGRRKKRPQASLFEE